MTLAPRITLTIENVRIPFADAWSQRRFIGAMEAELERRLSRPAVRAALVERPGRDLSRFTSRPVQGGRSRDPAALGAACAGAVLDALTGEAGA